MARKSNWWTVVLKNQECLNWLVGPSVGLFFCSLCCLSIVIGRSHICFLVFPPLLKLVQDHVSCPRTSRFDQMWSSLRIYIQHVHKRLCSLLFKKKKVSSFGKCSCFLSHSDLKGNDFFVSICFLKISWHRILYSFQGHNIVIQYLYTLRSDHHKPSAHLSLYVLLTIWLTAFPVLYVTSCDLFHL